MLLLAHNYPIEMEAINFPGFLSCSDRSLPTFLYSANCAMFAKLDYAFGNDCD